MPGTDLTKLSDRIKSLRDRYGISQSELARRLEISVPHIIALETGSKNVISYRLSSLIEEKFGINRDWLFEKEVESFFNESKVNLPPISTEAINYTREPHGGDLSEFERLLSEISATYINITIEGLENVLRDDFRRLTQALGFDTCILYMSDEPQGTFTKITPLVWFVDENKDSNLLMVQWLKQNPTVDSGNFCYSFERWYRGESVAWVGFDNCPAEASQEKLSSKELGLKSCLSIPLSFAGHISGVIAVATFPVRRTWPDDLVSRLRLLGEVFINALMRKKSEEKLQKALSEIKQLKERFEADYLYLREEIKGGHQAVVGRSNALENILLKVKQVAPTNATVLILGETGTGKGLIARAIHDHSTRRERPLMQVNCAALAPSIIESELFGHEKGAFTGAAARRLGRFEAAKGTTLFLDEIGDLPMELQPKLLRVLEEGEFERVGGNTTIHTDIRLIAATSRELEKEVSAGRFRSDLWYRLNIFPIFVPPLRERLDDIPLLLEHFLEKYRKWMGQGIKRVPDETVNSLMSYSWPGNVRELSNVIERALITSTDGTLCIEIPQSHLKSNRKGHNLRQLIESIEREKIIKALEESNWVIEGKNGAASLLNLTPSTLRYQAKKLRIKRPESYRTSSDFVLHSTPGEPLS